MLRPFRPAWGSRPALSALVVTLALSLPGCGNDVRPPCGVEDGLVLVDFRDGVRADSAIAALTSIGLPFEASPLRDCGMLVFSVTGAPSSHLQRLEDLTHSGATGVLRDDLVFASICATDPGPVIEAVEAGGEFTFVRIAWYGLGTTVRVPVGEEEAWIGTLSGYPFIAGARRVPSCID